MLKFNPPLPRIMKNGKIKKKIYIFIAQNYRLDALNAAQKTLALNEVGFLKKSPKISKNYHF